MGTTNKDSSQYFDGPPQEGWELADIQEKDRCFIRYYQDRQGDFHHTAVPKKGSYEPYRIELSSRRDGMEFASVIHKKTGKPHPFMMR